MGYAYNEYTGTTDTDYLISFAGIAPGYLDEDHVRFYLNGEVQDNSARTFIDSTHVRITAPITTDVIRFQRESSIETPLVDWVSGAGMSAYNLDLNTLQMLYLAMESADVGEIDNAEALAAAVAAAASAAAALVSETNAGTSETNADAAQTGAETAETNAETAETNAGASETASGISETNAAASETAAGISETNAGVSETNAAASETAAGLSETAAELAETNAGTSETNAGASASAASTSETNAGTSETNAGTSETNAAASAAAAAIDASDASDSADAAAASEAATALLGRTLRRQNIGDIAIDTDLDVSLYDYFVFKATSDITIDFINVDINRLCIIETTAGSAITWHVNGGETIKWDLDTAPTISTDPKKTVVCFLAYADDALYGGVSLGEV